jgi:glycosyltransferase involved in cell wall biosynthesis
MNVLFLTTNWPREASPVDGVFVREHARAAAEVADVRVLHLERSRGSAFVDVAPVAAEEPPCWRARYRRYPKPVSLASFFVSPLVAEHRFARNGWKPDVIHAHSFLSALPALALGRRLRRPVVYTEHWSVFLPEGPSTLSAPMRFAARVALKRADLVLPVSDAHGRALRELAPNARIRVIPNAVDPTLFRPDGAHATGSPTRLLTVGLFDNEAKGVDILLDALARLPERESVALDVVGDGLLRSQYEAQASRLGLTDSVVFHGLLPRTGVAALMRSADLFVLASRFDNSPCVLLEAMACGVPIVATRVGGVPSLVEPDVGALAEPNDAASLTRQVETMLERLGSFDRLQIAERAQRRFGRATIARELAHAYADVSARPAS